MFRVFAAVLAVAVASEACQSEFLTPHHVDASAWAPTKCGVNNQITRFGRALDPERVLQEYPRPQMVRDSNVNLNGVWQFEPGTGLDDAPPFGKNLSSTILVPFPVEACLSGVGENHMYLWYRLTMTVKPPSDPKNRMLLHFGAVDWNTTVYLNTHKLGNHMGGYDGFSFDITDVVTTTGTNELLVQVYDPSDKGYQVNGKQRISAITSPGGDTYTPASGIWQTVWVEEVPATYISSVKLVPTLTTITVTANTNKAETVKFSLMDSGKVIATATGQSGKATEITVPHPRYLWTPTFPFLYNITISLGSGDSVDSYFGLRTSTVGIKSTPGTDVQMGDRPGGDFPNMPYVLTDNSTDTCAQLCRDVEGCVAWVFIPDGECNSGGAECFLKSRVTRFDPNKPCRVSQVLPQNYSVPLLSGQFIYRAGWLDQSYWPDGIYTAPTDEGLKFDLQSVKDFGFNTVRLHQKVNPERWYYFADQLGIIILQDMPQKYGGATKETVAPFISDLKAMMTGPVPNHPSVVQWETFNEGDCWSQFDVPSIVDLAHQLDPTRPIDTDSGGGANNLHIGQVNDIHSYPNPAPPVASQSQYAMIGEFGGLGGGWLANHSWVVGKCHTYEKLDTVQDIVDTYVGMTWTMGNASTLSCSIYTQITDVELECDGFLAYDRSARFTPDQLAEIKKANQDLIKAHS